MDSQLILYRGVKINPNNLHNIDSGVLLNQLAEYQVARFTDLSIIITNYTLRIPTNFTNIYDCNYMAFQNPEYDNKWFFAYVTGINYYATDVTEVEFEIDYWSTWFGEIRLKDCFVEREIVASDTIGEHLVDEDLDVGEITTIAENIIKVQGLGVIPSTTQPPDYFWLCIYSDYDPKTDHQYSGMTIHNFNFAGHGLYLFKIRYDERTDPEIGGEFVDNDIFNVHCFLEKTAVSGHSEDVKEIFILPQIAISDVEGIDFTKETDNYNGDDYQYLIALRTLSPKRTNQSMSKQHTFTDYTPKNNKCFVYPYNFMEVTNCSGNVKNFRYEDFSTTTCNFDLESSISVGGSIRLIPKDYKGELKNYDEQLPMAKFPTCAWSSDAYINWLTQNAITMGSGLTSSALLNYSIMGQNSMLQFNQQKLPINLGISGVVGNSLPIINSVMGLIGQFHKAKLLPNNEHGSNTGDIAYSGWSNNFLVRNKRCKLEFLKIIDSYFTRFGYKINITKTPDLVSRPYWNYFKIGEGDDFAYGNIPYDALQYINRIGNQGITIWHNIANIGNYTLDNSLQ